MPRPRDIEPVEVNFMEQLDEDEVLSFEVPIRDFTFCFDVFLIGLAPITCRLGPSGRDVGGFGGYAAVAGEDKEYFPENEVVPFLMEHGLDEQTAVELLVEVNGRNMNRVV